MLSLVDLSGMFWPAYYVAGNGPGAYQIVMEQVLALWQGHPRLIVCCEGRRLKRYEWFSAYKANRPAKPEDATESLVATIAQLADAGVPLVSVDGYEADDLIATFTQQACDEAVQIFSQDKDLYQLLSPTVTMVVGNKLVGPDDCLTKFGVRPDQIRDYLTICGDASDNIPGCPGIGAKGAARLLLHFGTLESARSRQDWELKLAGLGDKTIEKFRAWDPSLALRLTSLLYNAPIHINDLINSENDTMADMTKIIMERGSGPLKILAYGPEGVGKTRLAAFSPKPIFLCAENGLSAPDLKTVPRFPSPDTWADVFGAIDYLRTQKHEFKTFAIDSLDWLHQLARAEVCRRENMSPAQYEDYGRGEKHTFELWIQLTRALDALQDARTMHIIMIAHSSTEVFPNPQGEDFMRYQLALTKKAAERWKQWPDFLLFLSQEMFTKRNKDDKASKGIIGAHRIFTQRSAAFDAKNRINLPPEIPYDTANPWRDFAAAVRAITAPQPKPEVAPAPAPAPAAEQAPAPAPEPVADAAPANNAADAHSAA